MKVKWKFYFYRLILQLFMIKTLDLNFIIIG